MRNPCRRKVMDMTISNPLMQPETISSVTASTCQFRQAADWFQSNSCPNRTALASLWLLRVLGKQQAPQHTSTLGISRKVMKHQTCATAPRELYHLHFTLQKGMLKDVVRVKNEIQQLDIQSGDWTGPQTLPQMSQICLACKKIQKVTIFMGSCVMKSDEMINPGTSKCPSCSP